jgi:hypothetical protein
MSHAAAAIEEYRDTDQPVGLGGIVGWPLVKLAGYLACSFRTWSST